MGDEIRTPGKWLRPQPAILFFLGFLLAGSGFVSPPFALLGGAVFGLTMEHPYRKQCGTLAKFLLQASVVLLGFGMNLQQVLHAGQAGFVYTAAGIAFALSLGLLLGRLLHVKGRSSFLISVGTAICGGSAIAAVAPILGAEEEEISVSMGTVFLLNSVALILFPLIGAAFHLSQERFGLWAALAIHDTSSVVGAAAKYGAQALAIGTTVKLARALWIVPVSLVTAALVRRTEATGETAGAESSGSARVKVPWFILLFVLASVLRTYLPAFGSRYESLNQLGRQGMTATLFLIGTGFSRHTLRQVGVRPLLQGLTLWIIVATASLAAILHLRVAF